MILAVDPGGTTGVVQWYQGQDFLLPDQIVNGRFGFYRWFNEEVDQLDIELIVCEDFLITQQSVKKTRQSDALRIIGYLDGWCFVNGVRFVLQTPNEGKGFGTDEKLKHVGWYTVGKPHATDAARHLLTATRTMPQIQAKLKGLPE